MAKIHEATAKGSSKMEAVENAIKALDSKAARRHKKVNITAAWAIKIGAKIQGRKARKDLDKQAVSKGRRVARPKTNSKLVSTKHGAFYLGKSSGRFKKPK
jgi:type II secretory pathway component GspD/PulD (secretin)